MKYENMRYIETVLDFNVENEIVFKFLRIVNKYSWILLIIDYEYFTMG